MSEKNEIQTNTGNNLAVPDYGEMANLGFDNVTQDDVVIPYLSLLQALSPQIDEQNAAFVQGAKAGSFVNTATNQLYGGKEGVHFIPCLTEHIYTEWKPNRGGFVARHELGSPVVAKALDEGEFGNFKTEAGNDLNEAFYIYGLIVDEDGGIAPIILAFSSTKIKAYKKAMGALRTVKGVPLFANQLRITSVPDKSDKGSFYSLRIEPLKGSLKASLLAPDSIEVQTANAFYEEIMAGKVKVDYTAEGSKGKGDAAAAENAGEESAF